MSLSRNRLRASLRLEGLESRLVPSWAGTPPASIPLPAAAAVTLNASLAASGSAAISTTETDYYSFVAPKAGSYRISALTPSSNLDTVLGAFDTGGRRLAFNDDMNASTSDSQLTVELAASQRVFVGITSYTGTPGGAYTWYVQGPQVTSSTTDDRYENNDSFVAAASLGTVNGRQTFTGLMLNDTQDWYRFTMRAAGTATTAVALGFSNARGDLDLRLYNASGGLLRSSLGHGDGERVSLSGLSAGTYYVQVVGYRGAHNSSYSLDLQTAVAASSGDPAGNRVLYVNFDGFTMSHADLVRWAGTDWWPTVALFDGDNNGISVRPFLPARADREQIISRVLQLLQDDLRPFGLTVRRISTGAVEGVGATTVFVGRSTLTGGYTNVASAIDAGNTDRTDIAFVADEDWGTLERTALAMADVILHEAGHTWGLVHVNSGTAPETMGIRYSISDSSQWAQQTAFLDRTFAVRPEGGSVGATTQNSYQTMLQTFGVGLANPTATSFFTDSSQPGVFTITTRSPAIDTVSLRRLASGNLQVTINGNVYELRRGTWQITMFTNGDSRDQVQRLTALPGVTLTVDRSAPTAIRNLSLADVAAASADEPLFSVLPGFGRRRSVGDWAI